MVAIGNAYDHTAVENIYANRLSDIYIQSPFWNDDSRNVINHDDNYMGQQEFVMPDQEGVMYRDTVTLYSSHVDTEVEIYGLPAPQSRADIPYELSFENSNAQTSFENEINTEVKGTIIRNWFTMQRRIAIIPVTLLCSGWIMKPVWTRRRVHTNWC